MSKGLGCVEEAVLKAIKKNRYEYGTRGLPIFILVQMVYNLDIGDTYSKSRYTTVCRAVKSLERKNYVRTEYQNMWIPYAHATRCKLVMAGPRMYEEPQWLRWYRRWDIKSQ